MYTNTNVRTMLVLACIAGSVIALGGCETSGSNSGPQPESFSNRGGKQDGGDNYLFRRSVAAPAPAPAPAPAAAPAPAPAPRGDCSGYRPNAGPGMNVTTMAFPTGDVRSSAVLVNQVMPAKVRANTPYDFEIHVTNLTGATLQNVLVDGQSFDNLSVNSSDPAATKGGAGAQWVLGNMGPCETRVIKVKGTASKTGNSGNCVTVSYNNVLCSRTEVVEPALSLTKSATPEAIICDCVTLKYVVKNTGTGVAENVVIKDTLPAGLTVEGKSTIEHAVGNLAAGESKEYSVCAKAAKPGSYSSPATATAAGLNASAPQTTSVVKQPALAIECKAGKQIFIGRDATFEFTVKNTGDAPAANTTVTAALPAGATFVRATEGGASNAANVSWNIGTLAPNASKTIAVTVKPASMTAVNLSANATAVCAAPVSTTCATDVVGIPALLLDGTDDPDPIEVGGNVVYTLSVTNQGSAPLTNVQLVCDWEPETMQYVSSEGTTQGTVSGKTVTFAPIQTLAPKERRTYKITVKALKAGQVQFKGEAKSAEITRPLVKVETTNFYQ
jgi:uncharacterized repeat protein (TIGR01451 family)